MVLCHSKDSKMLDSLDNFRVRFAAMKLVQVPLIQKRTGMNLLTIKAKIVSWDPIFYKLYTLYLRWWFYLGAERHRRQRENDQGITINTSVMSKSILSKTKQKNNGFLCNSSQIKYKYYYYVCLLAIKSGHRSKMSWSAINPTVSSWRREKKCLHNVLISLPLVIKRLWKMVIGDSFLPQV